MNYTYDTGHMRLSENVNDADHGSTELTLTPNFFL